MSEGNVHKVDRHRFPTRFESYYEYQQVLEFLTESEEFEPVAVTYGVYVGLKEFWFRNLLTSDIVKVSEPDGPLRGMIEVERHNDPQ